MVLTADITIFTDDFDGKIMLLYSEFFKTLIKIPLFLLLQRHTHSEGALYQSNTTDMMIQTQQVTRSLMILS